MGPDEYLVTYNVDVVFCIDATESMTPYLTSVQAKALEFHSLLLEKMRKKDKLAEEVRVRIVSFRDLGNEGPDAIEATRFFRLPAEGEAFKTHVDSLQAVGGGDIPESGLEALAVAIRSPWQRDKPRRRHVIVVCTDSNAHELGKHPMRRNAQEAAMPTNLSELHRMWGDVVDPGEMERKAKRLLLFAPEAWPWSEIAEKWEYAISYPSSAGHGLASAEQSEIFELIAGSL